jgi:dTDP-4-dehydrorhamnose reductase
MDIADPYSVDTALALHGAWAIVNAAGYVRVDEAERDAERCLRENTEGAAMLAEVCRARDISLVTFSSDLVFPGDKLEPYRESDPVAPLNAYGRSKAEAERRVLRLNPDSLVVRTSAFFGPWDEYNFVTQALRTISVRKPFAAAEDVVVSPTYLPDLVDACLDLLIDGEHGIWHLANPGAVTWADFGRRAADLAGLDPDLIQGKPMESFGLAAPRPRYSALTSERAWLLPPLEHALLRYMRETGYGQPQVVPIGERLEA